MPSGQTGKQSGYGSKDHLGRCLHWLTVIFCIQVSSNGVVRPALGMAYPKWASMAPKCSLTALLGFAQCPAVIFEEMMMNARLQTT